MTTLISRSTTMSPRWACAWVTLTVALLAACGSPPAEPSAEPQDDRPPSVMLGGSNNQVYNKCMLDAGWLSQEMPDGGLIFGAPVEQQSAFDASDKACMKVAGMNPSPSAAPLTKEQFRQGYESVSNMRACLAEAGFTVGKPPSLQAYIDSNAAWSPFDDLPTGEILSAEEACPQNSF